MAFFYPERKFAHQRSMIGGEYPKTKAASFTIAAIFTIYTVILTTLLYLFGYESTIYNVSLIFSAITGGGFVPTSTALNLQGRLCRCLFSWSAMIISALPFAFHYAIFSIENAHHKDERPEKFTHTLPS